MPNILAVLPASEFIKLAAFTSKDETRPYLKCVNIEPASDGGCIMVATEGKIMGVLRLPADFATASAPLMVSTSKDVLKAARGGARECLYLVCRDTGMDIVIADNHESALDAPVKSTIPAPVAYLSGLTFPQWRKVLPEAQSGTRQDEKLARYASINPDLLAPFTGFGEFLSFDWNGHGAISVATGNPYFYGVVMPGGADNLSPTDIRFRRAYVLGETSATVAQAA